MNKVMQAWPEIEEHVERYLLSHRVLFVIRYAFEDGGTRMHYCVSVTSVREQLRRFEIDAEDDPLVIIGVFRPRKQADGTHRWEPYSVCLTASDAERMEYEF